jgi:uncharacterized protein YyaL (SSP411 family)
MRRIAFVLTVPLLALTTASFARSIEPPDAVRPTNRLARETSSYLRQHAHNPVDWFPWGPEAFEKAQKEKKLVFLSIGYSACHWCHVMERESFSNAEIAKLLNASFVCIKVDREERPDVDQIYMTAVRFFNQSGGWPLSMFLTADGKPIAGGTYWPPEDKLIEGQKALGFKSVLRIILDEYRDNPKEVTGRADEVAKAVARTLNRAGRPTGPEPRRYLVTASADALKAEYDPEYGGFGNSQRGFKGPKFPMPPYLEMLQQVKSRDLSEMLTRTLDGMAEGGIYDQLGGGFHRYSTERTWSIPHFEKMLNDNAQLVEVYARAFTETKKPMYRRIVEETLAFVGRELAAPGGGFYSSLDADSDGQEGRFYVWTAAEIDAALPDRLENTAARVGFGIADGASMADKVFVLVHTRDVSDATRQKLFTIRTKRVRPNRDTKILTAWNGQMIAAYAVAGKVLEQPSYVAEAERTADFILKNLRNADGRLLRTFAAAGDETPRASLMGYLDDYACLTHGLLRLHDATGSDRWLAEARSITDQMIRHYGDESGGGFFYTADDHEKLFARAKDMHDGAQPSGNSVAIKNLLDLAAKTGEARYRDLAGRTLKSFTTEMEQNPTGMTGMVAALDQYLAMAPAQPPGGAGGQGGGVKRSDAVVKATATADKPGADGKQTVKIKLVVDKAWHIYANPVGNQDLDSAETKVSISGKVKPKGVTVDYPKGTVIKDMLVGNYTVYEGTVEIKATVERAPGDTGPLEVTVKFQACNEKTCLLPGTVKLTVP